MTIRTRKFCDFNIHTAPECRDSPEAMAEIAAGYGDAGIAITNHIPHQPQKPEMTNHPGIKIVAKNPHHLRQMIRTHRAKVRVRSMHGGNEKINRAALSMVPEEIIRRGSDNRIMEGVWIVTED